MSPHQQVGVPAPDQRGGDSDLRRWAFRAVVLSAAVAAGIYGILRIVGLGVPYLLLFAIVIAYRVVRRSGKLVAEPSKRRMRDMVRQQSGPVHGMSHESEYIKDGLQRTLRQRELRLDWAVSSADRFEFYLSRDLGDLVDERLRLHHGITRASDPQQARRLCGEPLWTLLHAPVTQVPRPRQLIEVIAWVEAL